MERRPIMTDLTVAQTYALMIPRIPHMDTEEIEDLLRDLQQDDPDREYSDAAQDAAQEELEYRWMLGRDAGMVNLVMSDGSTRPHKLVARAAPQRAIVAAS